MLLLSTNVSFHFSWQYQVYLCNKLSPLPLYKMEADIRSLHTYNHMLFSTSVPLGRGLVCHFSTLCRVRCTALIISPSCRVWQKCNPFLAYGLIGNWQDAWKTSIEIVSQLCIHNWSTLVSNWDNHSYLLHRNPLLPFVTSTFFKDFKDNCLNEQMHKQIHKQC